MENEKRLIDANALTRLMCRACNNECCEEPCEPGECFIYDAVNNAPTVDAVEVVHAHWEDGYGMDHDGNITYKSIDCSHCEGVFEVETYDEQDYWKEIFKHCPFCGAKMDGGNEDG